MILEKICIQEFLKGGALSTDRPIEERAPPVVKTCYLVIMLNLDGSEKALQKIHWQYLVENRCMLSL